MGIIGAGTMGNGIAQACAVSGLNVVMVDINEAAVTKGLTTIASSLDRLIKKEKMTEAEKASALARIKTSTNYQDFTGSQMVIEAATENYDLKIKILKQLDGIVSKDTIIASNTSSISITQMAAEVSNPQRFIGMHFFNPVPMMKLVEIIRGLATEDATYQAVEVLAKRMGKAPVMAQDWPGFVVNRILCPMINEAIQALMEGVGDVAAIDAGMKLGANHPMGPLELADFVGLDTLYSVMKVLHEGLGDSKYRPSPLLAKYVEAGWYGRKSGRGFYDYSTTPPTPTR